MVQRYKWSQSLALPGSQAGRRAGKGPLALTLKPPVMWGVKVQQYLRQIPRLQSGQKKHC